MDHQISYNEFHPDQGLKDYIKSYWFFKIKTNTPHPFEIFPDGYFDLLIVIQNNNIISTRLTGLWRKSVSIEYSRNTEVIGIRFKPFALGALLPFKIKELLDGSSLIDLKEFGINSQMILDGLNGFPKALINKLDRHFLSLLNLTNHDNRIKHLFELVESSFGTAPVHSISDKIGLSNRQIQRNIHNMIGIGVKEYSKIIRFRKTLRNVKFDKSDYYPYFDQSHFIKEVKLFTNFTPDKLDLNNNVRFIQYYNFNQS